MATFSAGTNMIGRSRAGSKTRGVKGGYPSKILKV
jgi:hypothetical protein